MRIWEKACSLGARPALWRWRPNQRVGRDGNLQSKSSRVLIALSLVSGLGPPLRPGEGKGGASLGGGEAAGAPGTARLTGEVERRGSGFNCRRKPWSGTGLTKVQKRGHGQTGGN